MTGAYGSGCVEGVGGEGDAANARILASRIPQAQLHQVHGGGHVCLLDRAAEVGPVVSAFLRSLEHTAINEVAEFG